MKKEPVQLSDHFTYGKLLRFVYPSIMMIFTSIYGVVDGLFVSNFVGKTSFDMRHRALFNRIQYLFFVKLFVFVLKIRNEFRTIISVVNLYFYPFIATSENRYTGCHRS